MWLAHNVAYGMLTWLRSSAYNALEPLAPAHTLKRRSGDIVSMATADIETIELFFAHTLVPLMVMILVPTALLMGLATVAWPLGLVLLPFLVLVASLPLLGRRRVDPVAAKVRREQGRVNAHLVDSIAGKSTCVCLLLRFWDPNQGTIRLGDIDLRDFPLDDLRRRIAIVQQDNYLVNTSIRENIRLGNPAAAAEEVEAAARAANIHEFIVGLPNGYDTIVGERGAKLSGGQRQRLALARACLKNAPILVLDEATSNLDSENERLIKAAVARLMRGRTTLVIAHRLSTIISADRVVMLDRGQVVASGLHADLVAADGPYAQLIAAQRRHT
jgi:ABC-type multidrug transport system fused ATPase/permease subunit